MWYFIPKKVDPHNILTNTKARTYSFFLGQEIHYRACFIRFMLLFEVSEIQSIYSRKLCLTPAKQKLPNSRFEKEDKME